MLGSSVLHDNTLNLGVVQVSGDHLFRFSILDKISFRIRSSYKPSLVAL